MKLNRKTILLASLAAMLFLIGGTVAFLVTQTGSITNTFLPSEVKVEVKDGTVENTGDIDVYVRAALVTSWADGTDLYAEAPKDPVITKGKWVLHTDGYYYWPERLEPKGKTDILTASTTESAPEGYSFTVEIGAQAIQADPAGAIADAWPGNPITN